jgi:hypothetical protein
MRNYRSDLITTVDFLDDSFKDEIKPKKKIKIMEKATDFTPISELN